MLEISDLKVNYGKEEILHGISLNVEKGKIIVLAGESGSGKSTLLKALLGLLGKNGVITQGSIRLDGQELCGENVPWRSIRGSKIGMIFQNPEGSLDPVIPVGEQIRESLNVDRKISRKESDRLAKEAFSMLKLPDADDLLKTYPFELSGGMCQRVAIAMAMMRDPQLLLADEPTSALDVSSQMQTIDTLRQMRDTKHTSILLVTHNLGVAAMLADEIGIMKNGKMVEYGDTRQILYDPQHPYTKLLLASVPKIRGRILTG